MSKVGVDLALARPELSLRVSLDLETANCTEFRYKRSRSGYFLVRPLGKA